MYIRSYVISRKTLSKYFNNLVHKHPQSLFFPQSEAWTKQISPYEIKCRFSYYISWKPFEKFWRLHIRMGERDLLIKVSFHA